MTEDILFDNIYVGHSAADAKKLAAETFHIKKKIEDEEAEKAKPKEDETTTDSIDAELPSWKEEPLEWLRVQAFSFYEAAKADPVAAFKSKPETGAAIVAVLLTFFGSLGALFGLIGGSQKPVKSAKKVDVPSKAEKKAVAADAAASVPTAKATATDATTATKRK